MTGFNRSHIRTRLTLWFVSAAGYCAGPLLRGCVPLFVARFTPATRPPRHSGSGNRGRPPVPECAKAECGCRDDYHNHPESKQVLERLLEVRSTAASPASGTNCRAAIARGDTDRRTKARTATRPREFTLADGLTVQLVSRRHYIDGLPTIIRVALSEEPLGAVSFPPRVSSVAAAFDLVITGIGGYLLASKFLKPIQQMARQAEAITSEKLHERLR